MNDGDKPNLTVVPILGHAAATINDIPGQLEQLAKDIRAGKVEYQRMLVVGEDMDGCVDAYGWGIVRTMHHDIGLLYAGQEYIKRCTIVADALPPDPPMRKR